MAITPEARAPRALQRPERERSSPRSSSLDVPSASAREEARATKRPQPRETLPALHVRFSPEVERPRMEHEHEQQKRASLRSVGGFSEDSSCDELIERSPTDPIPGGIERRSTTGLPRAMSSLALRAQEAQRKAVDLAVDPAARVRGAGGVLVRARHPLDGEAPAAWARAALVPVRTANAKPSHTTLIVELPAGQVGHYRALQEESARLWPKEQSRPSIRLTLRSRVQPPGLRYGVVGGVGPLADADVACRAVAALRRRGDAADHVQIELLSKPPPRSLKKKIAAGLCYARAIRDFLRDPAMSEFLIASNTAHAKYGTAARLSRAPVFHLVNDVVERVALAHPSNVLLLGTREALRAKLYQRALDQNGVPFATADDVERGWQARVDDAIATAKGGDVAGGRALLLELLRDVKGSARPAVSHVGLCCTEIPLVLEDGDVQAIFGEGVRVIDTSQHLADHLAAFADAALFADQEREAYVAREPPIDAR